MPLSTEADSAHAPSGDEVPRSAAELPGAHPQAALGPSPARPHRFVTRGAVALLLLLGALVAAAPIHSVDFFWHLELGEYIDATRRIPTRDLFSAVHPDKPYVQFQWLWDVLAFKVFAAWGLGGVRVVQVILMALSLLAVYSRAQRLLRVPELACLLLGLALLLFEDRFRVRPAGLTLGLFALSWPVLFSGGRGITRKTVAGLAILSLVWANLDGGASLLLVVTTGAVALGASLAHAFKLETAPASLVRAWVLVAAAALGPITSPTALEGVLHWSQTIGPQLAVGNREWLPPFTILEERVTASTVMIAAAPTAIALVYLLHVARTVRRKGWRAAVPSEWILSVGLLFMAHQAVRNVFLCLVPLAFVLRERFAQPDSPTESLKTSAAGTSFGPDSGLSGFGQSGFGDSGLVRSRSVGFAGRWVALAAAGLSFVVVGDDVVRAGYGGVREMARILPEPLAPGAYPESAGRFLKEAEIQGGLINPGQWGGYLIHQCWPRCHVFADSRHNFTPEMWRVFLATMSEATRPHALNEAFARWGVELAVFKGPVFSSVKPPEAWQLLFKAGPQEVWQHRHGAHAASNKERARRYFAQHGHTVDLHADPQAWVQAAARVGLGFWQGEAAHQRYTRTRDSWLDSSNPADRFRGHKQAASLAFHSSAWPEAIFHYEAALMTLVASGSAGSSAIHPAALRAAVAISDASHPLVVRLAWAHWNQGQKQTAQSRAALLLPVVAKLSAADRQVVGSILEPVLDAPE